MIAFGSAISEPALYVRCAKPGIRRAAESDSAVYAQAAPRSIAPILNLILDQAAGHDDLEALVLVDQRAEILDADLCGRLRQALREEAVAVVGCAGARGVRSIAWWEGSEVWASSVHRCAELGGADLPPLPADGWGSAPRAGAAEVETVDGLLMALSPWAVRNVRFDEALGPRHGFDYDFCQQVRAAGRKVRVEELAVAHERPLGVIEDPETWAEAHMRAAAKWDRGPQDWKPRARRAEGRAAAARLLSATKTYEIQALTWAQERELAQATGTMAWKVTEPLRRLGALARAVRQRRG